MSQCDIPLDWVHDFSQCLFEWQTLFSGLAAVCVAVVTVIFLRRQIAQSRELFAIEREARLAVARAKAPAAAVLLSDYAKECILQLNQIEPAIRAREGKAEPLTIPTIPAQAGEILDALIANTDDRIVVALASAVYTEHQVFASRMQDIHVSPRSHGVAIDSYYLQPLIVYAIAISLLAYGRLDTPLPKDVGWEEIESSAESLIQPISPRKHVLAMIKDKAERMVSVPFVAKRSGE